MRPDELEALLGAYALDAVDEDERRAVEDYLVANPRAQADTISCLIEAGADPNAADPRRRNNRGSTPVQLATRTTGRGGSGSAESKAQLREILDHFRRHMEPKD